MSVPARTDNGDPESFDDLLALIDTTPITPPRLRKLTLAEMDRSTVSAYRASNKVHANDIVSAEVHESVSAYSASRNPSIHPEGEPTDAGTLWAVASRATRARKAGRQQRRALRFPAIRSVYARARFDADGLLIRMGASYRNDVWRYLQNWGYRTLNDLDGAGYAPPSLHDLANMFEQRVIERGHTFYGAFSNRGHGISTADLEVMAERAAAQVLSDWSPDWIREMKRRGATGGRKSRPSAPPYSDADLDRLGELNGLTVYEQSRALGVSMSTVDRMRRVLRDRPTPDLDDLLARGLV